MMPDYKKRWGRIRSKLDKSGYDAFVITMPGNVRYLSCSDFVDPLAKCIIISGSELAIASQMDKARAAEFLPMDVKVCGNLPGVQSDGKKLTTVVKSTLKEMKARKVLSDTKRFGRFSQLVNNMRMRKDSYEIRTMKEACRIAGKVSHRLDEIIITGKTELEAAREIDSILREHSNVYPFPTIVASGKNTCYPHSEPSSKRMRDVAFCDFGAYYKGYCTDTTRTVLLSNNQKLREIFNTVNQAQKEAIKRVRQGEMFRNIDRTARNIIKEYGYDRYFVHGCGHGIGLEIHEAPSLLPSSRDTVENGMIFTVEPGVYVPGLGGVRTEDMVLSGRKAEILTR